MKSRTSQSPHANCPRKAKAHRPRRKKSADPLAAPSRTRNGRRRLKIAKKTP